MKLLHTADWHVGKGVRGRSRADEHTAVLAEIAGVAASEEVDLVVVAGDLFDAASPPPDAERIVYRALLDLADGGARPVVVVAGNHDHAKRLGAVGPLLAASNVHVADEVARPDEGGVLALQAGGVPVRIALLPFVSQRGIVGADELMALEAGEHAQSYGDRLTRVIAALATGFEDDAVNLVVAHAMVAGGVLGGGERSAHTIFEYSIPATAFPASAHYVALGHLHRTQQIGGPCPIWYPGSPLQLDFGEQQDRKHVLVVEAEPGIPARVTPVALTEGRTFRTMRGTLEDLRPHVGADAEAFVRLLVRERQRVGLVDDLRDLFPDAVEIRIELDEDERTADAPTGSDQRTAPELFADYLDARQIEDPRLLALFEELHDEAVRGEVGDAA